MIYQNRQEKRNKPRGKIFMRCGIRKIDKSMQKIVSAALNSGRWEEHWGRKHMKLIMKDKPAAWVPVAGSSCDPVRAAKNLTSSIRHLERDAGFAEFSV
jgi:hypothetical protein